MTHFFPTSNQSLALLTNYVRYQRRQLLQVFWLVALGLLIFELFWAQTDSLITNFGAVLITSAALLPGYLWCSGRALGMPIFPLFALTYIWTYGLPLVTEHPRVLSYSHEAHLFASVTVAGFLFIGTIIWFPFVKSPPPLPKYYRALSSKKGDIFFLFILGIGVLFRFANNGGWLVSLLEDYYSYYTAFRGAILGTTALASFVLAYKLGNQELSKNKSRLFLTFIVAYIVGSAVELLLIGAASTFLIAIVGFIFGRQKIPFLPIIISVICLFFLHYGKAEMRAKYWSTEQPIFIQPWQYPTFYNEWVGYSWDYLDRKEYLSESQEEQSFSERASLIHMLLLAQKQTPESAPYLYGKTYAILPGLAIPRIFNPNKVRSHEGTYILSVYYGLQTEEETYRYSISWGLLPESYANFGEFGCAGLGIILGIIFGKVTRWSINAPILSAQSLFAVLILTLAFQTEWTAGVYIAGLSQSGTVFTGIVVVLMETYWASKLPTHQV
ncbi:MAG: hypothetical protein AAFV71_07940 [Cyanobacteria bacterium J06633_8]